MCESAQLNNVYYDDSHSVQGWGRGLIFDINENFQNELILLK